MGVSPCQPSYISVSGTNSAWKCFRSFRDRGRSFGSSMVLRSPWSLNSLESAGSMAAQGGAALVSGAHGYAVALRMVRFRSWRGSEAPVVRLDL